MIFKLSVLIPVLILAVISCSNSDLDEFIISDKAYVPTFYYDENTDSLILWAINDLADDIEIITGIRPEVLIGKTIQKGADIYIGEINYPLIRSVNLVQTDTLGGKWESFHINLYQGNLIIAGSDVRGTVYGIFEVAERLGISPWKWWADLKLQQKEKLSLKLLRGGITENPSVQYRGIFLNDEDWGLQPWAAKTFEPETGDIGPKTYEKIFQLLLRLKANTIWPAMHSSTKAFFKIPGNKEMAEKYHIFTGTSHAEPMLRNNVDEWDNDVYGDFNYFTNSEKVREYWQERITEARNGKNIITMGMRGIHDSGMRGNTSSEEQISMLGKILEDQREILVNTTGKPIEDIPQVLIPYKEVLYLYNGGLKVPDDITLMWTDDNYGYIRRLSNDAERKRSGGSGVYYHLSYWGRPHDYLWLSTTQPGLIWYEMTRAYHNDARKIWIVNVGDIKPAEYNMEFFLNLAWDINSINESSIKKHLIDWSSREFGDEKAEEIADVLQEYYRLAFLRKPEYMGWSQTEPTTPTKISEFTTGNNNELQRRIDSYLNLFNRTEQIKPFVSIERKEAYFQLVEYPVKCAALMNCKFLYAQQAYLSEDINAKELLSDKSLQAYNDIKSLTFRYSNEISGGKWQEMMTMDPRNLPVFTWPDYHLSDVPAAEDKSVAYDLSFEPVFVQASDYVKSEDADNYKWKIIKGLGYSNSGVTLFPFDNHTFDTVAPHLEYGFNVERTGRYDLEIRCLPTHANNFDHKLWIKFNDRVFEASSLNTKGRSETWKINVLQNFVAVNYPLDIEKAGKQTLKIYVNQTGIVLDQIAVTHEGYGEYYEVVCD